MMSSLVFKCVFYLKYIIKLPLNMLKSSLDVKGKTKNRMDERISL